MLPVQSFLENHSLKDLWEQHGVSASFSKDGSVFSLNYDQIAAKETDPLANQCRALILAMEDGQSLLPQAKPVAGRLSYEHIIPGKTRVMARAFDRFFNYGQEAAAKMEWNDNLRILTKLDGSLCVVWYNPFSQQWNVATRSCPYADLPMENGTYTFRTLFEKALQETCGLSFADFSSHLNQGITYCFELTTPMNTVVVRHNDYRITLLAARELAGEMPEFDLHILTYKTFVNGALVDVPFNLEGVPLVESHPLPNSMEDLVKWVNQLNADNTIQHEGIVLLDEQFRRIKIKNPSYLAAHRLTDRLNASPRNLLELLLLGKDDDALPFLPDELKASLQSTKLGLQRVLREHDNAFVVLRAETDAIALNDKKQFALAVNQAAKDNHIWSAPLFRRYDGKCASMQDFINQNQKEGTYPDSFLDKLLDLIRQPEANLPADI